MSAQEVADLMLAATTRDEIAAARRAARAWLEANGRDHPDAKLILSAGEQLYMMEGAIDAASR